MIFPKIKETIFNSEFLRKNDIKNKLEEDLIKFIDYFLMYNIDIVYLENYISNLIQEFVIEYIDDGIHPILI